MTRTFSIISLILLSISLSLAEFTYVGQVESFKTFPNRIEFKLDSARLNVYVYDDNVIRFLYTNRAEFSKAPSYAVICELPSKTNFTFKEEEKFFLISTKELIVHISKSPARVSIYDHDLNLINADDESFSVSFDNDEVRCHKKLLAGENFYGLGEKSDGLRKTGNEYTLWNTDFWGYNARTDELYLSIPFFYGIKNFKAYGILFDNTFKSHFNFGASNNRFYWFGAENGEMDYYFIYGPEIKKVLSAYTKLTGRMELPPMWALGYQQCRWSYYPESNVRTLANTFRNKNIPCDVLYLDIHYMDGYKVFTWDKNRFPDPKKMISDLKSNGFKMVTIIDPGVKADTGYFAAREGIAKNLFAKYPDGTLYQGEVWPSWAYFPDFTKKETRIWWGDKLSLLMNDGIEGFWNDMNEPAVWGNHFPDIVQFNDQGFNACHKKIHNVYALEMAKATRTGLRRYSDRRHFILTRAGFAGMQRYAAAWTGDNVANEEHLKLACVMPLNIGLSGLAFIGADVGGFMENPSQRLYLRWMELGAFTPLFRQHSAYGTKAKEPWAFGEDIESAVREVINLRYKLLPYFYSEFYVATQTGWPVMRPMFLNFQTDQKCYDGNAQYQFMVGDNLLVAPVLSENDEFKRLYLPAGNWYELNTKQIHQGNQWLIINATLNQIPLFVKDGGIIPMQAVQQYVGEKKIEQTEMLIFPAASSFYALYEDDGISYEYENGRYSITNTLCEKKSNSFEISVKKEKDGYKSDRKNFLFKIISEKEPVKIIANAKELSMTRSCEDLTSQNEGYYFNANEKMIYIKVQDRGNFTVTVDF